jgi:hypothetical protein
LRFSQSLASRRQRFSVQLQPKLMTAGAGLEILRTPEGEAIPPNTLAALKRDLERHRIVKQQIRQIEQTRLERLDKAPAEGPHAMVLARVIGIGVETADMLVQGVLSRNMRDWAAVARACVSCGAQCPRTARQWASSSRFSPLDSAVAA